MKIIDFERKGNVTRFYLGEDSCSDYWGDDWNDAPYEHNAGKVYDEYVKSIKDIAIGFDNLVLEPKDDWRSDSHYSKEDMKNKLVPCVIIVPYEVHKDRYEDTFPYYVGAANVESIYFGDDIEKVIDKVKRVGVVND